MIEVVDTTLDHVRAIRKNLREEDRLEAERMGLNPWKAPMYIYKNALWRRTGLINGEPAALWGVRGNPLGLVGNPYLVTSNKVYDISAIKFAKIYLKELNEMKKMFPVLENYVDAKYDGAVRLLRLAGFELELMKIKDNDFFKFSMVN